MSADSAPEGVPAPISGQITMKLMIDPVTGEFSHTTNVSNMPFELFHQGFKALVLTMAKVVERNPDPIERALSIQLVQSVKLTIAGMEAELSRQRKAKKST